MLQVTQQTYYFFALHRLHKMNNDTPFFSCKFDLLHSETEKFKDC